MLSAGSSRTAVLGYWLGCGCGEVVEAAFLGFSDRKGVDAMRLLRLFGVVLLAMFAVGVMMVGVAFAESLPLPLVHTALPGETYPINLGGHLAGASLLRSESGTIEATEFSVLLNVAELTALGTAVLEFLGLEEPKEKVKCNTLGDSEANGAVLVPNAEFHLVYTSFAPLEIGALVLFTRFTIECNHDALETTIRGPVMTRVNVGKGGAEGDITDLEFISRCANTTTDIQEIPYYYNDSFSLEAVTLLANISGTGLKKSCELIEGTVLVTPETGSLATMFTVLW
jgi:hypothetical protein